MIGIYLIVIYLFKITGKFAIYQNAILVAETDITGFSSNILI